MVKGQPEAGAMQQHNWGLKGSIKSWQAIETAVEVRTQWRCFIVDLTISFKDLKNICAIKLVDVFLIFFLLSLC